jgi:hypothetical protein
MSYLLNRVFLKCLTSPISKPVLKAISRVVFSSLVQSQEELASFYEESLGQNTSGTVKFLFSLHHK